MAEIDGNAVGFGNLTTKDKCDCDQKEVEDDRRQNASLSDTNEHFEWVRELATHRNES